MALSIKDDEADRLARALARETGETMTQAIIVALRERLQRFQRQKGSASRREKLRSLRLSMRELPVLDPRSADEILGYGKEGLPR